MNMGFLNLKEERAASRRAEMRRAKNASDQMRRRAGATEMEVRAGGRREELRRGDGFKGDRRSRSDRDCRRRDGPAGVGGLTDRAMIRRRRGGRRSLTAAAVAPMGAKFEWRRRADGGFEDCGPGRLHRRGGAPVHAADVERREDEGEQRRESEAAARRAPPRTGKPQRRYIPPGAMVTANAQPGCSRSKVF
jgi:hypothetical protein